MRILYSCVSGQLGGAEISMLDMLAGLRSERRDWEIGLVVPEDGPVARQARLLGIKVCPIPFPAQLASFGDAAASRVSGRSIPKWSAILRFVRALTSTVPYLVRLRGVIEEFEPDVMHAHGFKMIVLCAWTVALRVPIVWHLHDYVSSRPIMRWLLKGHRFRCAIAITNSRSTAADLKATCGQGMKVVTVYNAVDTSRFHPEGLASDLDQLSNLPPAEKDIVRVGLVATMAYWKGHAVFLRAISLLSRSLPIRAYIIGGALYKTSGSQTDIEDLRALAEQLGISERVGFTGFLEDSASAMRALDIVVHASTKPEPFGMVIAEAMASGTSAIVSDAGGAAEVLALSTAALGFYPGNVTALAKRIEQLSLNPETRREMESKGLDTVRVHFDKKRLTEELIGIYREVAPGPFAKVRFRGKLLRGPESTAWGA